MAVLGLVAVLAYIAGGVAIAAAIGRHDYGSVRAWWRERTRLSRRQRAIIRYYRA